MTAGKKDALGRLVCPKCGSAKVRREFLARINIGCMLMNVLAFATFLERPGHFARRCRACGHRFVN
jgi:hypothetical protein